MGEVRSDLRQQIQNGVLFPATAGMGGGKKKRVVKHQPKPHGAPRSQAAGCRYMHGGWVGASPSINSLCPASNLQLQIHQSRSVADSETNDPTLRSPERQKTPNLRNVAKCMRGAN